MAAAGHEWVSDAGVRAATVSCLTIDGAAPRLSHLLRERGFEVGAGYGALDDALGEL